MSAIKKLLLTTNIDPAKLSSGDVGVLITPPGNNSFMNYSITATQLWKLGNVVYDSGHADFSYVGSYGSNTNVLSDYLDPASGNYIKQFDFNFTGNGTGYAGFYFGAAPNSSAGTSALNFKFYSAAAGTVIFTARDTNNVQYACTKVVVAGWQTFSIPWIGVLNTGFSQTTFAHPANQFYVDTTGAMPVGTFRIDTISYDAVVTMAASAPTVLNGVQFALTKVDPGTPGYNLYFGDIKINQVVVDGPAADPTSYKGIPRWNYKWVGSGADIGYGAWRGPSAVGYNWLMGWQESGIINPDNGRVLSASMLQMMYDSQQAYKTQFPLKQIGPFMPRYGRASWEALTTSGYVAGVLTSNTYNKWYYPSTDDWYGYMVRALLSVAGHYYLTRSAQAKTVLDNWMAWLDVYIIADGVNWQPPSDYYNDGTVGYTYKPVYAYTCIAAACIYKYWVDGDALALKWYRRMLDTIYATKRMTGTGTLQGISRTTEGKDYTAANVVFTVNGGAVAPTATAIIAGGKIVRYVVNTAGSGITSISAAVTGDGSGATCNPYLSDLLVGAFDANHTGWELAEIFNTYAMLVNGSRPGATVTFPTTLMANDTTAYNGLVALYQRNTVATRPSFLTSAQIPLHEWDIDPYHNGAGIENPMLSDTHARGAMWTETLGPTLYASIEYYRQSGSHTWLDALYALVLEFIGLPGGSTQLANTPRLSNGLSDAYTDMIGGEPLQANKRGNLDTAIYVVNASKQIVIPAAAFGGNVTWVRGVWPVAVPFRYDGYMADVDPAYVGDTTNYALTATNSYAAGVYSTIIQLSAGATVGASMQVYYSYRDGSTSAKGDALSGYPSLHRDPYQGTANDGDNYLMMALYHAWRSTGDAKYKTAADRIGAALLDAGRRDGNEATFALPFDEEAGQTGLYSYHATNTPLALSIAQRVGQLHGLHVTATVLTGQTPANYAGFGLWPSWSIGASTPFTSFDFSLLAVGGNARQIAQAAHERFNALVMRTHLDWCGNTFGVNNGTTSFCTATGTPCYNTYGTCKDKTHYVKSSKVREYCLRGMAIPPGETLRPYITVHTFSPTELPVGGGLAVRSNNTITLADEVCTDYEDDPYIAQRTAPAGGTYQTRLLARNYNYYGRQDEVLKGYVTDPFDWTVFQTELYVIDQIAGPDSNGNITYTLSDLVKPLDKNLLPAPTTGKIAAVFKAIEYSGYVAAADATHITFAADASAIDAAYVSMEVCITQNTAAGERRSITAYNGAARQATLSAAWAVTPDTTSVVQVSALSIDVGAGNAAQYHDPAITGEPEFICIGKEVIRYTALAGNVLSWPDSTYRAQWGTVREDHSAGDAVNQCLAFTNKSASYVAQSLLNACGIANANIDLVGLAIEDTLWLGSAATITACVAVKPEKASGLLNEFLQNMNMMSWWDPVAQQQKFKCDMPVLPGTLKSITPDEAVGKTMKLVSLDNLRITQSGISYAPYSATGVMTDRTNFKINEIYEEANAESANEYNGVIQTQIYSRWLTAGNATYARALMARRIGRLRDAPWTAEFSLDPKDEVHLADLINVNTRKKTDATGAPVTVAMRVTKLLGDGNFMVKATSTNFYGRGAFIAPDGTADYPADTTYAHISDLNGLMSDGSAGYTII